MTDIEAMNAFMAEPRNAVLAGIRADGRPHLTPNWFVFDGERFFISTTNDRAKYRIFSNDARAQLIIDDVHGFRYIVVDGLAEVSEDNEFGLPHFKALRNKHGRFEADDAQLLAEMERDGRVLLIVTPSKPQSEWHQKGFDS